GFKPNDIVLTFAGKPVTDTPADFTQQVNAVKPGEKVDAVVVRKGKKVELKGIELPEKPVVLEGDPDLDMFPFPLPGGGLPGGGLPGLEGFPFPLPGAFPGGQMSDLDKFPFPLPKPGELPDLEKFPFPLPGLDLPDGKIRN